MRKSFFSIARAHMIISRVCFDETKKRNIQYKKKSQLNIKLEPMTMDISNQFNRCFFLLDAFEAERVRLTLVDIDVGRFEFD